MSVHSRTRLLIHIVWGVKIGVRIPSKKTRIEVRKIIIDYAESAELMILSCYVNSDHVHILLDLKPEQRLSDIIKILKGASSHMINRSDLLIGKFAWSRGFGAFSVSESKVRDVKSYISSQEKHHQIKSYKDEYEQVLTKHNLERANR